MLAVLGAVSVFAGSVLLLDAGIRWRVARREQREAAKRRHPSARRRFPISNVRTGESNG